MRRAERTRALLALLAPLLVLSAIYAGVAWLVGRQVPAQATVLGVHIGGMTPQAARERLTLKLAKLDDEPVVVALAQTTVQAEPSRLGLSTDLDGTLSGITGFSLDPRRVWYGLTGGGPVPLRTAIDYGTAAGTLAPGIAAVERPVTQAAITLTSGRVQTVRPQEGLAVDLPATLAALQQAWPQATRVEAVIAREQPAVSPQAFDRAVEQMARPALAQPLTVVFGRREVSLPVAQFAPALRVEQEAGALALRVDGPALAGVLYRHIPDLETEPVDATVRMAAGGPAVVPAVPGRGLDERASADAALAALTARAQDPPSRRAAVVTRAVPAAVGTEEAQAWGVQHRLAQVVVPDAITALGAADAQRANVAAGVGLVSGDGGRLLAPGETLSLAQLIGDPAGRFADAPEPSTSGAGWRAGGGLSQLASALYAAAWSAGVDLGPRRAHPVYLPDYPEGLDATYAWGEADVSLTNPGPGALLVHARTTGGNLEVTLWGRRDTVVRTSSGSRINVVEPGSDGAAVVDPGGVACVEQPPAAAGFDIEVRREVVRGRTQLPPRTEVIHYEPVHPVSCPAVPPTPEPVPPTPPHQAATPTAAPALP